MIQSIQVRLVALAIRLVSVFAGTLLAAASLDHYQGSSGAYPTTANSCEAPAMFERLKTIEFDRVLIVIGEALVPFGK